MTSRSDFEKSIPYRHILVNDFIPYWVFNRTFPTIKINSNMESNNQKETWMVRVKREYKERGFTQETFAEKIGMTQTGLSKKLSGSRKPTLEDLEEMAKILTEADPSKPISPSYLAWGYPSDAEAIAAAADAFKRMQSGIIGGIIEKDMLKQPASQPAKKKKEEGVNQTWIDRRQKHRRIKDEPIGFDDRRDHLVTQKNKGDGKGQ